MFNKILMLVLILVSLFAPKSNKMKNTTSKDLTIQTAKKTYDLESKESTKIKLN
jgi:hypothetical protein